MKRSFFQATVVSILVHWCTTWTLTKRLEKKLDGDYTRMLHAILNMSWSQHPTRHQLYDHLPLITKTIQARRTRHAGHCWRSRDELISNVLQWTSAYGQAKAGRPARTYIQQLCEDTGYSPEDLSEAMNDTEKWRERVRDIRANVLLLHDNARPHSILWRRETNASFGWTILLHPSYSLDLVPSDYIFGLMKEGLRNRNGSSNLVQTTRPKDSQQKKRKENQPNCGLCYPGSIQIEKKRKRKERKHLDLSREQKNYGTWRWRRHRFELVHLEQCPNDW